MGRFGDGLGMVWGWSGEVLPEPARALGVSTDRKLTRGAKRRAGSLRLGSQNPHWPNRTGFQHQVRLTQDEGKLFTKVWPEFKLDIQMESNKIQGKFCLDSNQNSTGIQAEKLLGVHENLARPNDATLAFPS